MSSSLYARYVPPKKKAAAEPSIIQNAAVPRSQAPPPALQQPSAPEPFVHPSRANPNIVSTQQLKSAPKRKHDSSAEGQNGTVSSYKKAKKSPSVVNTAKPAQRPPPQSQAPKPQYESKEEKRAAKIARRAHQRALEQGLEAEETPLPHSVGDTDKTPAEQVKHREKKAPKRPKNKPEKADVDDLESENEDQDAKHKSILEKRAKSLKKAEKIARKEKQRALERGEDIEAEDAEKLPEEQTELHALEPLPQPEPAPKPPPISIYSALPSWLGSPIRVAPTATAEFETLGLPITVAESLKKSGFKSAFAVQASVLPLLLPGQQHQPGDVLVSAATGSGKTLSYVLPMVEDISRTAVTQLRGLIVMPTRELVTQAREVSDICANAYSTGNRRHINVGVAVGNQTLKQEQASLMKQEFVYNPKEYREHQERTNAAWRASSVEGSENLDLLQEEDVSTPIDHLVQYSPKVDIMICTPGRLVEHLKSTVGFTLEHLKWLVIDEADKLLDQSFQQWLETVMNSLSSREKTTVGPLRRGNGITKVVLSATMTRDVGLLSQLKLYKPKFVVLEGHEDVEAGESRAETLNLPDTLHESAVKIDEDGLKPLYLLEILKRNGLLVPTSLPHHDSDDSTSSSGTSDNDTSDDDTSDDDTSDDDTSSSGPSTEDSSDGSSSDDSSDDESSSSSDASSTTSASFKKLPTKTLVIDQNIAQPHGVLIFTKSNENAVRLSRLLTLLVPSRESEIGAITSTTSRKHTLRSFRKGALSVLIASDLVSRGLDLPNLAHVINYDMPTSITSYVHRVGRTARAGKQGAATTLFSATEGRWFWNDIARSGIKRTRKVERITISAKDVFTEDQKQSYEEALERLGEEARGYKERN